ncbi:MAG: aminotransferase class I/II-fold pyridoxal phosphate-dependent enzyme [Gemmatimonadetes bacterium]|nr:aminotransferase class I/II-fold pyridoxal phosphate-dependent enzyme [Gemmatimonadota bacterium]
MTPVDGLVRDAVRGLPPYRGLTGGRPPVLLDGNENPLGPAPGVLRALAALDGRALARYPAPQALRQAWATALKVRVEEVVLTSGSGPAIALAAELVLGAGDTCVLAAPCFELYGWAAQRREARIVAVPCQADQGFAFPAGGFRRAVEGAAVPPRLVIIGYPDNPTGTAPPRELIVRLAREHRRTLFLVDEAYTEFYGSTMVPLAVKLPNLLVTRTFSKALGLAGERIGGLIGNAELIDLAARINVPYPVTAAAAALGLAALEDRRHLTDTVRQSRRAVRRLGEGLSALGQAHIVTRANFVLLNLHSEARAGAITAALARRGVAIRNRSHLPGMAGWVRISAGTDAEVERFLDGIRLLTAPAPEALLFDMDGVLVDVSRSYDEAIVQTVASFLPPGRTVTRETVLEVKERPDANDDHDATVMALARLGLKPKRAEVERRFQERYLGRPGRPGLYRRERWLLPRAALRLLAGRLPLAIVTGRTRAEARLALRSAGVAAWFKAVITVEDVRGKKPDPAPVRAVLKRLGVKSAWLVGDGPADLIAARRAGIPAVAVLGPAGGDTGRASRREAVLRMHRPLALLGSGAELVEVFEERDRVAKEGA